MKREFSCLESLSLLQIVSTLGTQWTAVANEYNKTHSSTLSPQVILQEYKRLSKLNMDIQALANMRILEVKQLLSQQELEFNSIIQEIQTSGLEEISSPTHSATEITPQPIISQNKSPQKSPKKSPKKSPNSKNQIISTPDSINSKIQNQDLSNSTHQISISSSTNESTVFSPIQSQTIDPSTALINNHESYMDVDLNPNEIQSGTSSPRKNPKKKWKLNSLMIWDKIADHRNGNVFLRKIKDANYNKCIKEPINLDTIKTRIREGLINTTSEFHRDLSLMFANAMMYNDEDSEIYGLTHEIKQFADTELKNLLIDLEI